MTRYEENFKQMIVELNQTGRSVRGLAKEYGLSEATIYKWKNLYLPDQSTGLTGKEVAELKRKCSFKWGTWNLKKSRSHILSENLNSLVQFIEKWCKDYTVSLLCRLLEILEVSIIFIRINRWQLQKSEIISWKRRFQQFFYE